MFDVFGAEADHEATNRPAPEGRKKEYRACNFPITGAYQMSDVTRFVAQIKLEGPAAEFVRNAIAKENTSAVQFLLQAIRNESESVLEGEFPALPVKARKPGIQKGSKIPEARELDLSTKEYKRRVRLLTAAGVKITAEAVKGVPAKS